MQLCLNFVDESYSRYINVTMGMVLRCDWIIMKHDSIVVTICITGADPGGGAPGARLP
jgi:hypothetical protein